MLNPFLHPPGGELSRLEQDFVDREPPDPHRLGV
jgi:hypothetical protein